MKNKIYIIGAILVLTSLTALYAQPVNEVLKVVALNNQFNSDRDMYDNFGESVSISGDYAIVGAAGEDTDENGLTFKKNAGAAYIFERIGGIWTFKKKIVAPDRTDNDQFGYSVAISGNYVIVGAYAEDHDENGLIFKEDAGAAYIFKRISGTWDFKQKIAAPIPDRAAGNYFGARVSISGDYAIVGAGGDGPRAQLYNIGAGSAYIFERCGTWNFTQKLQADDRAEGDAFGSVSISGNYAIVGASREDEGYSRITISNSGSAYIFKRDLNANLCAPNAWMQTQKIEASDRETNDHFGSSVAISGDYAIVGADWEYDIVQSVLTFYQAGSAYIFERNGNGIWDEVQKIVASDRAEKVFFGSAVAIDGNYVIVGAHRHDRGNLTDLEFNSGAAYIFERDPTPPSGNINNWNIVKKIVNSDTAIGDDFGIGVAISGCSALVGAFFEDEDTNLSNTIGRAGSAYFFECEEPEKPEPCCDINDVEISLNPAKKFTEKFNLKINSGGTAIQDIEVSMIDYHVEYNEDLCKPDDMGIFGTVSSYTPNFSGLLIEDNNTQSVSWNNGTPVILNGNIGLTISKPKALKLNCCDGKFYFCLKVKIKDADCNVCEKIVCGVLRLNFEEPREEPGGGGVFDPTPH